DPILDANVLPAIGAALRGVREAYFTTNFLRHEGADHSRGKALSIVNAVLVGLLFVGLIGWGGAFRSRAGYDLGWLKKKIKNSSHRLGSCAAKKRNCKKREKKPPFFRISVGAGGRCFGFLTNCRESSQPTPICRICAIVQGYWRFRETPRTPLL